MKEYTYVALRQKPELKEEAAAWFHDRWKVSQDAYLECMEPILIMKQNMDGIFA